MHALAGMRRRTIPDVSAQKIPGQVTSEDGEGGLFQHPDVDPAGCREAPNERSRATMRFASSEVPVYARGTRWVPGFWRTEPHEVAGD